MSEGPAVAVAQVDWEDPADARLAWMWDRVHTPEPVPPLAAGFGEFVAHGFTTTFQKYSIPVKRFRHMVVDGYQYSAIEPLDEPPAELERLAKEAESILAGVMAQLGPLWRETYLPEIRELLAELEAFDLRAASMDELLPHWDRAHEVARRLFEIHFLILIPSMLAVSEFDELYRSLLPSDDPHASYRLLGGFANKTLETGRALFELSRKALREPEVLRALEHADAGRVLEALEGSDAGRAFGAELRVYLNEYGQRGDKWDISYPSWIEDPTPVIVNLKEYVRRDDHPAVRLEEAAERREQLVAQARERLMDNPMLPMFEFLLAAAQEGIVISEDHGFWIDFRGGHRLRCVCMEFGRRFAEAGVLDGPEDVFYLRPDELVETGRVLPGLDRRGLVSQRRADLERWSAIDPPEHLGNAEAATFDDNPIARAFAKFMGREGLGAAQDGELRGHPGSPGTARGRARLIRTIADAERLEPGEVLVAETTSPPWTPLFATASAVVTDSGGILSHCAVVAREYGIPAVVGCGNATTEIADGRIVEVDGTEGVVRLV